MGRKCLPDKRIFSNRTMILFFALACPIASATCVSRKFFELEIFLREAHIADAMRYARASGLLQFILTYHICNQACIFSLAFKLGAYADMLKIDLRNMRRGCKRPCPNKRGIIVYSARVLFGGTKIFFRNALCGYIGSCASNTGIIVE